MKGGYESREVIEGKNEMTLSILSLGSEMVKVSVDGRMPQALSVILGHEPQKA